MSLVSKLTAKTILPALNASMIAGFIVYFGEIPPWIIFILGIFFVFGKDIKNRLIRWFTQKVDIKVHKLIFGFMVSIWGIILAKKIKT